MSIGDDVREAMAGVSTSAEAAGGAPSAVPVPTQPGTGNQSPEPTGTAGTGPARGPGGRFAAKAGDKPTETATPAPPNGAATAPPAAKRPAPQFIRPTVREKWDAVPPEMQEEIERFARVTGQAVQLHASHRKTAETWEKVLLPYRPHIQGDPVQWADNILRTAVQLQTAPRQQRAQMLAQMVRQFDVDVNELDGALVAGPGQTQQPQAQPQEFRDPRFDQFLSMWQGQQQESVDRDLDAFAKDAEFLDEPMPDGHGTIREQVADLVDMAEKRGDVKRMGLAAVLKRAYSVAVAAHPTVSEAVQQRKEAAARAERDAQTAHAKAAASSVRTEAVVSPPAGDDGDDLHATVRATMANLRQQRR